MHRNVCVRARVCVCALARMNVQYTDKQLISGVSTGKEEKGVE